MEEYLPDDLLMKVHSEGLQATRTSNAAILLTKEGQLIKAEEQGLIEVPDHATRHKFLDTALKLKDKYPAEKHKHQVDGAVAGSGNQGRFVGCDRFCPVV